MWNELQQTICSSSVYKTLQVSRNTFRARIGEISGKGCIFRFNMASQTTTAKFLDTYDLKEELGKWVSKYRCIKYELSYSLFQNMCVFWIFLIKHCNETKCWHLSKMTTRWAKSVSFWSSVEIVILISLFVGVFRYKTTKDTIFWINMCLLWLRNCRVSMCIFSKIACVMLKMKVVYWLASSTDTHMHSDSHTIWSVRYAQIILTEYFVIAIVYLQITPIIRSIFAYNYLVPIRIVFVNNFILVIFVKL